MIRSRRDILRLIAGTSGIVVATGCARSDLPAIPSATAPVPASTPTISPLISEREPTAEVTFATREETVLPSPTVTPGVSPKRLVGYLPSWTIGREYAVADVPAGNLTHLIYAFAKVTDSGECASATPKVDPTTFAELRRVRKTAPQLQMLISIGGDGGSSRFPNAARSADARQRFATSCITFMKQNGFDGIDVDWEYPDGSEQKGNFTAMLAEIRSQLDAVGSGDGKHYVLTIAGSAGPAHYVNLELDRLVPYVDWINLMAYAFHGTWSPTTNFNAPLFASSTDPSSMIQRIVYNTDAAVQAYLGAGVPADKIVVGVPFYGYGWKGVPDINHGLYQQSVGLPDGTRAKGVFTYRDLKNRFIGTYQRYWHDEAQVPWLYDPTAGIMITYDDPTSLAVKADYIRSHGLGGAMIWELSTDDVNHSLVTALYDHLHATNSA